MAAFLGFRNDFLNDDKDHGASRKGEGSTFHVHIPMAGKTEEETN